MQQDKIWDAYQNDPTLQDMGCRDSGRVAVVASLLTQGSRVLNVGVGKGTLEHLLKSKGIEVYSLDPSRASIARLQDKLGMNDRARVGYAQDIPFNSGSFDYVVMSEVLEHLSDSVLKESLSEVRRVLVNGGTFLGTVPADENLNDSQVVCPDCGKIFHRWGHVQSFSEENLRRWLSVDFKRVDIQRRVFVDWQSLNWKGKLIDCLRVVQAKRGALGSGQNFLFRAIKVA